MDEEELKGVHYWENPLSELMKHPDYSPHAQRVVHAVMNMTSAQLESLKLTGDING